ncbi:MAG: hypothetical protein H0V51_16735 [Chloroflexi bacterium]|nr:hypothetical protein [Chloroflexota bacterium]
MDCVVSFHLNALRSGVAKFNEIIARRFNVPLYGIYDEAVLRCRQPLLSLKVSDLSESEVAALGDRIERIRHGRSLALFLHTYSGSDFEHDLVRHADAVYCGNSEVYADVCQVSPRGVELWSPATILDTQPFRETEITVFSFGMAHKIRAELYGRLRTLLEATGKSYSLVVSTAFHESVSFDHSSHVFEQLRETFGEHLYFMGFLSDAAVYNFMVRSTFFAAFFDGGVRANNSTVVAGMQHGSVVVTNLDAYSPTLYAHMDNVIDINRCASLPTDAETLARLRNRATETVRSLSWDAFVTALTNHEAERSGASAAPLRSG